MTEEFALNQRGTEKDEKILLLLLLFYLRFHLKLQKEKT